MAQVAQTLKGFRDFLPAEKRARDFVAKKVVETFEQFGFEPLETPTLEYASLLLGKYGTEADKLVYTFTDRGDREIGLRYDQTVPTARVLAQYQNQLPRYFRRYQIQNVFRADKPQKGRYREFTQCDIDIFGSTSPIADAEILACTYFAFKNVGFTDITLAVNDRQILIETLTPFAAEQVPVMSIIQSIDKLDKQTPDQVVGELVEKGMTKNQAEAALGQISTARLSDNLQAITTTALGLGIPVNTIQFQPTLARGLDYYTGMIFEVKLKNFTLGSFGGGGRYDHLIHQLGGPAIPAVGIAFGFDRMIEAAKELHLIPQTNTGTQVLITIFDAASADVSLAIAATLRKCAITTEVFPGIGKLDKQLKYADQKQIPLAVVIGPEEVEHQQAIIKDLRTSQQTKVSLGHIVAAIQSCLHTT